MSERPAPTPEVLWAVLRLMCVVGPQVEPGSVAYWDQRTSGNDARSALSIAAGGSPDEVHPARGTWDRPTRPVQLTLDAVA
jgi:hypothetical protein